MVVKRKGKSTTTTTTTTTTTPNKQQKKQQDEQPSQPPIVEEPKVEEQQQVEDEQVIEEVEEEIDEEIEEDEPEEDEDEDEDEESISTLIEPFTKEQLVNILKEAAENHADVATTVRNLADKDPVHRKIFVHGLGWDTTTDTLRTLFEKYGEIEDCKAVSDKLTGKSKGYGFVLFKTRTGAKKALQEPQKTVSGRTVACQLSAVVPVANNSNNTTNNVNNGQVVGYQSEFTQRKIYISNVSAEIDPIKLKEYFSRFGEIEDGPLGIDKSTGKFKGFCLFVYKSVESARKALEEPQKVFEGHSLNCKRAVDGPKGGKGGGGGGGGGGGMYHSGGRGRGGGGGGGGYVRGQNPNLSVNTTGLMTGYSGAGAGGLNPALGHALTALLASQGAGLGGLNNMLGVPMAGQQMGGYGSQSGYPNQQMGGGGGGGGGQGSGVGRTQYGGYNGAPYGGL